MGNCVDRNRRYADLIVNWLASPAKDRQSEPFGQAPCGFAFKLDVRTREMRILCKLRTLIMMIVNWSWAVTSFRKPCWHDGQRSNVHCNENSNYAE